MGASAGLRAVLLVGLAGWPGAGAQTGLPRERNPDLIRRTPLPVSAAAEKSAGEEAGLVVDAEREAITVTAYDLDVRMVASEGRMSAHARMTVRNDGPVALTHLGLQLSSTLSWQSLGVRTGDRFEALAFSQHGLDTDADHTGRAVEAQVTLARPLAPGASLELTALYGGVVEQSGRRLERIGAPVAKAAQADWDQIGTAGTALRGFGNVLWYPVSAAPALLGDGAKLFEAAGRQKRRNAGATIHLRLTVEYVGVAPAAAFFCGREAALEALPEDVDQADGESRGLAVAEFPKVPLGYRVPSLFVVASAPIVEPGGLVAGVGARAEDAARFGEAAAALDPLLTEWLGPASAGGVLTVLDHAGQPFEDGALLVTPMHGQDEAGLRAGLAHSLVHARYPAAQIWIEEGLAEFVGLLWKERTEGREAALAGMQAGFSGLAVGDAGASEGSRAQTLIAPESDLFYRTKAQAVWWMLRSMVGDDALKQALKAYRPVAPGDRDAAGFQGELEKATHRDLRWFFDDWVYHDRGLPDLSIVAVTPRELAAEGSRGGGWLVSVSVKNDGNAAAEVPVTVTAGALIATERLRVAGQATASIRILFDGVPQQVTVNDGSVPELRTSLHTIQVNAAKR